MPKIIKNEYIISHDDTKVEAWSKENIPFEPKEDWQKKMREEMREALRNLSKLSSPEKKELYASYYTEYVNKRQNKSDVENILLYNIGPGAFTDICGSSICIERGTSVTTGISIPKMPHYYKYELVNKAEFKIYEPLKMLAVWNGNEIDGEILEKQRQKQKEFKASFFWNYLKKSDVIIFDKEYHEKYGIEVAIETPHQKINLASIMKPLLDGIICAFHKQNEKSLTNELIESLSKQVGYNNEIIKKYLLDDKLNLLGECDLVRKHR